MKLSRRDVLKSILLASGVTLVPLLATGLGGTNRAD